MGKGKKDWKKNKNNQQGGAQGGNDGGNKKNGKGQNISKTNQPAKGKDAGAPGPSGIGKKEKDEALSKAQGGGDAPASQSQHVPMKHQNPTGGKAQNVRQPGTSQQGDEASSRAQGGGDAPASKPQYAPKQQQKKQTGGKGQHDRQQGTSQQGDEAFSRAQGGGDAPASKPQYAPKQQQKKQTGGKGQHDRQQGTSQQGGGSGRPMAHPAGPSDFPPIGGRAPTMAHATSPSGVPPTATWGQAPTIQASVPPTGGRGRPMAQPGTGQPGVPPTATWGQAPTVQASVPPTATWGQAPTVQASVPPTGGRAPTMAHATSPSGVTPTATWGQAPTVQASVPPTATWGQAPTFQASVPPTGGRERPMAHATSPSGVPPTATWGQAPTVQASVPPTGGRAPTMAHATSPSGVPPTATWGQAPTVQASVPPTGGRGRPMAQPGTGQPGVPPTATWGQAPTIQASVPPTGGRGRPMAQPGTGQPGVPPTATWGQAPTVQANVPPTATWGQAPTIQASVPPTGGRGRPMAQPGTGQPGVPPTATWGQAPTVLASVPPTGGRAPTMAHATSPSGVPPTATSGQAPTVQASVPPTGGRGRPMTQPSVGQPGVPSTASGSSRSSSIGSLQSVQGGITKPIERGTAGIPFKVEANYLLLGLEKMINKAYHYDVKIEPNRPKKFMRRAFECYIAKYFHKYKLAYDGNASAYCTEEIPEQELTRYEEAEVSIPEGDNDPREKKFKISLKTTADHIINLNSLKTYHKDRIFDKPMRALQCIEVVLSSSCHLNGTRVGRSFFSQPDEYMDLGDGYELWLGLYQAAMLCDQPMLNIDVSHKSFPTPCKLIDFYNNLLSTRRERDRRRPEEILHEFLKGLSVTYTPPPCFNSLQTTKVYKYNAVKGKSSVIKFKLENGRMQTVAQYYQSKGYKLAYPDHPCIHLGNTIKSIFIPIELLSIAAGQAVIHKDNENQVRSMIRAAATSTDIRKKKIMSLVDYYHKQIHPIVTHFGISLGKSFIDVPARLLPSPQLLYGNGKLNINSPGEWRLLKRESFLEKDKTNHKWAIITLDSWVNQNSLQDFAGMVDKLNDQFKIALEKKPEGIFTCDIRDCGPKLKDLKEKKVGLVFVIIKQEQYSIVKKFAEISYGIVTQCIKSQTLRKTNLFQIIEQMLLKVNAKLNGVNHKIVQKENDVLTSSTVMFVGADVSHPSPQQTDIPSIVGVVASHDKCGVKYNMQYSLQKPGQETIKGMQEILTRHLHVYKRETGTYPKNIIYYRDGVSDGQFTQIEKEEVGAMRAACKALKLEVKFTCLIVVKRHHTRLFPFRGEGEGKNNNVRAGTVVDQRIVHPGEKQFFMVSHKSIQGTARPTRYNVIVDDANIKIDDLQRITFQLCHLFPRCNRAVSLPTPAYLAHLVGLRGRAYIQGEKLNMSDSDLNKESLQVSDKLMASNPMYFV